MLEVGLQLEKEKGMEERYTAISKLAKRASQQQISIKEATQVMRATMIVQALETYGGNRAKAAKALGLQRATLNAEIKRLIERGVLSEEATDRAILEEVG